MLIKLVSFACGACLAASVILSTDGCCRIFLLLALILALLTTYFTSVSCLSLSSVIMILLRHRKNTACVWLSLVLLLLYVALK